MRAVMSGPFRHNYETKEKNRSVTRATAHRDSATEEDEDARRWTNEQACGLNFI